MKMTTLPTPTIDSVYPPEVLQGGGPAVKWIKNLSREKLHSVVQDKSLPNPMLRELARNVPVKFLKNLINHKKLDPDSRITGYRRIFRSSTQEMKNEEKLSSYKAILSINNITDKEKRIVNSYIQEIKKLLKNSSKQNQKASQKPQKIEPVIKTPPHVKYRQPIAKPDSTLEEIVRFLVFHRSSGLWKKPSIFAKTQDFKIRSALLCHENNFDENDFIKEFKTSISPEDLLSFRMEIDSGLYDKETSITSQYFIEQFRKDLRGNLAINFLEEFAHLKDWSELLFSLMLKAVSEGTAKYIANCSKIKYVSTLYEDLIIGLDPILNYGHVNTFGAGSAEISFSASVNLEIDEFSFKYWPIGEDESASFPVKLNKSFNFSSRLYQYSAIINRLTPGGLYIYGIYSKFNGRQFKLEPREFKVPKLPTPVPTTVNPNRIDFDYGAPVPVGGGAERRAHQF